MNHEINQTPLTHAQRHSSGFTLIELMLSMTFIAALLLGIALTVIQVGNLYNKGMTIKEITQSGRTVAEDLKTTVSNSGAFSIVTDYVTVPIGSSNPAGGRFCTGKYSYIWNFGKTKGTTAAGITQYASTSSKKDDWINLVKVSDVAKIYCARSGTNTLVAPNISLTDSTNAQSKELLAAGDHEVGLHQFDLTSDDVALRDTVTGQQLYSLEFTVGTNKYIVDDSGRHSTLDATYLSCLPPSDQYADPNYCSVETFALVLRAGNRFN